MRIAVVSRIAASPDGTAKFSITIGKGSTKKSFELSLESEAWDSAEGNPTRPFGEGPSPGDGIWAYRGYVVEVTGSSGTSMDDVELAVKHSVVQREKSFQRMRREIDALENLERLDPARRARIPDAVRLFVWQRDQGKCVRCGRMDRLEFDHIVPVVKGGSNTERNVQLLCEQCNRSKGAEV